MADMIKNRCSSCFEPKGGPGPCPACGWDAENPGLQSTQRLKPGTVLHGVYAVGKVLGQGGFGITYLAWDSHGGRKVAIKECFPDNPRAERTTDGRTVTSSGTDRGEKARYESAVAKFIQEASTLSQFYLEPEIVNVLSFFRENNTAYMVMEHLEGHSLGEEIRRKKRLPAERVEEVALSVCRGLKAVHGKGILHRDVSPDNIFVTDEGKIKLIDFGTARDMGGNRTLTVNLKHGYAPWEQYTGRDQGPWTDIYALGATLYRALTGKLPPRSEEREVEDGIRSPSELGIELPERVEGAVMKALSVRIADRFQDVGEFAEALTGGEVSLEEPEEDGEDLYTQKTVWYRGPEETQEVPAETEKEKNMRTAIEFGANLLATSGVGVPKAWKEALPKPPGGKVLKQVLNLPDGSKYEGEVVNGKPHGKGTKTWFNGNRYEGDFVNGKPRGKGIAVYPDGDRYDGDWVDGKIHGKGTYTFSSGNRYEGDWVDGKRTGKGILTYAVGECYEGDFVDGIRHGKGTCSFVSGSRYEGDWVNGKRTGKGIYTWPDGTRYEGDSVNDRKHGKGTQTWPNGDRYEGDFVNDKAHGKGVMIYADGARYEGDWIGDKRTGKGTYTSSGGDRYEGDWVDGKKHGKGVMIYADGTRYEGKWVDDERAPVGVVKEKTGNVAQESPFEKKEEQEAQATSSPSTERKGLSETAQGILAFILLIVLAVGLFALIYHFSPMVATIAAVVVLIAIAGKINETFGGLCFMGVIAYIIYRVFFK